MGETRVDLLRLLEDLRDAYPGSVEETIVAETVANALDSGAGLVRLHADPAAGTFTVIDDGKGMSRKALSGYHDLAVTSKRRGRGIGFAGVGIKLGLLLSDEVITETKTARAKSPLATSWRLASRTRAPWRWIEPPGLLAGPAAMTGAGAAATPDVAATPGASGVPAGAAPAPAADPVPGTAVRLYLTNPLSQLTDPGFLEASLLRHFESLFDGAFDEILAPQYPDGVRFSVNGRLLPKTAASPGRARIEVRIGRQRKPSGIGFLWQDAEIADEERGIGVSTMGKVINRGWDWLGLAPNRRADVGGLIEVPSLAESLTLNKADFIRSGSRGATFLAYRKALQEAVSTQLEEWGEAPGADRRPPRRTRTLERDLQSVLTDLSGEYPLLATLVERSRGGQRRLPLGGPPSPRGIVPGAGLEPDVDAPETADDGAADGSDAADGMDAADAPGAGDAPPSAPPPADDSAAPGSEPPPGGLPDPALPGSGRRKTPMRYGLRVRFASWPDEPSLGRLVESTVWVNDAHPAYRRAAASRSEGYHVALTVAMALASLAVEPVDAQAFVTDFLSSWGEAGKNGGRGSR